MRLRLPIDTAATLTLRPATGPASAVAVEVFDPDGASISSGAATASTLSTTLDGAHTARAADLTLASGANVTRGQHVWVGDAPAPRELVQVDYLLGVVVRSAEPVRYPHADGVAVVGADWTYALTAGNLDALGVYRVQWTATVDGVATVYEDVVEVVQRVTRIPLSLADARAHLPTNLRRGPSEVQDEALLQAGTDRVLEDIERRGYRADRVRDASQLVDAAVQAVGLLLAQRWARNDPEAGALAEEQAAARYEGALRRVLEGRLTWYDADDDGVPEDAGEQTGAAFTYIHDRRVGEVL